MKNFDYDSPVFIGKSEDFHKFFSGFARNKVQTITNSYKQLIGKCQHCGSTKSELKSRNINLESAHVKGKERKNLINKILHKFKKENYYRVELEKFEELFIDSHRPIENVILILCKPCHNAYDNKSEKKITSNSQSVNYIPKKNFSEELKIGQYIKSVFIEFFENNMLSKDEIDNLLNPNYSKKVFGISSNNLAIIRHVKYGTKIITKSGTEHNRYWTNIFENQYYVYSQWINTEEQWSNFKKWEEKIKNNNK